MVNLYSGPGGGTLVLSVQAEHQDAANAKRSLLIGFDGANYNIVSVNSAGEIPTTSGESSLVEATFQVEGTLSGTALTGTYATLLNLSDNTKTILLRNSCNQTIIISFNASTTHITLERTIGAITIDFASLGLKSTATISVKHAGVVPTGGNIYVTGIA